MDAEKLRPTARQLLRAFQVRSARSRDLANALAKGELISFSDGDYLCNEGDGSDSMFVVIKGSVKVLKKDVQGIDKELAVLSPPSIIGQMGLVDGSLRSASCVAVNSVGAISISLKKFNQILSALSPDASAFRHLLISTMMAQLSSANSKISALISDIEDDMTKPIQKKQPLKRESEADRLMKIAGVLDGWDVSASGIHDKSIKLVEDEDMKRTREARGRKRW